MKFRSGEFSTGTKGNFQPELTGRGFLGCCGVRRDKASAAAVPLLRRGHPQATYPSLRFGFVGQA
jgi:hypothetical protein